MAPRERPAHRRARSVDHFDPFSYTAPGAEWINRQWLFDLVAFASWRFGGDIGLTLVTGAGYFTGFLSLYVLDAGDAYRRGRRRC